MGGLVTAAEPTCWTIQACLRKHLMDDVVKDRNRVIDDDLFEAFDVQQTMTRSQNDT